MKSSTWTLVLAVGIGILVAVVGLLQWRWIEEIEYHEDSFRRRQLGYSTWLFKMAFDREISALARSFEGVSSAEEGLEKELSERREHWRRGTRWPGLLRSVARLDPDTGSEGLKAVLGEDGRFEPATIDPEHLQLYGPWIDSSVPPSDRWGTTVLASIPAIVISTPRQFGGPTLVLELDLEVLRTRLLPELVLWIFPSLTFDGVELAVVESDSGRLVYSTLPIENAEELGRIDAKYGLAPIGLDPLPPSYFDEEHTTIPSDEWNPTEEERAWFRSFWSDLFHAGHWRVLVRRGEVPIEQEVAAWASRETLLAVLALTVLAASVLVLLRATRGAQRFARQRLDLIARISHELRTPLAVLAAAGENLNDDVVREPAQRQRYGRLIHREAQRLGETVENVLHLARRDSGVPGTERGPVDLVALVEETLRVSAAVLEPDAVEIEVDLGEHPPIVADAAAVRSAILNLISNALKYGRSAGWLGVSIERRGRELRLSVSDRGPGIDSGDLPQIFEPYFRGERARTEQAEGSGLGLAVVRDVMVAHGGRVGVQTGPERGTTFHLDFPLSELPVTAQPTSDPAASETPCDASC